jgi:CheY-like chemotaxis protein
LTQKTVLVVDDDEEFREGVEAILEMEGFEVLLAGNGFEAIEKLADKNPSLILLDIMMPRMDGFTFAKELRQSQHRPRIPILVITANGRAKESAERMGAEGFLDKPFTAEALLREVHRLA